MDPLGAIERRRMLEQTVKAAVTGVRQGWDSHAVAPAMDPNRLARLLQSASTGSLYDYLTLAQELEERDLFYRSQITTRKLACQGLPAIVTPASDEPRDVRIADAVRERLVEHPAFKPMLYSLLDAIPKGYSAVEIGWSTADGWWPEHYWHHDPRWFCYDDATARELRLLSADGEKQTPLEPRKWVVHEPPLISAVPARRGIARPAAFYHLIKAYDVSSWAAFVEVFGYPIRLGKYGPQATEEDLQVLDQALANIGRDVGARLPSSMDIDIVGGVQPGGGTEHFHELARFCNNEMAIGINGQLASTEGTPGRLGSDDAQDQVRKDILQGDSEHLATPVNRDLVRISVDLNFGPQQKYPRVSFVLPDKDNVQVQTAAVAKLVPLGLKVAQQDIRDRLRLRAPADDDEVLAPPARPAAGRPAPPEPNAARELNAAQEADLEGLLDDQAWEPVVKPVHDAVERLAAECGSYEEMERRLPELLAELDADALARRLAVATMKARGLGDRDFGADE